MQKGSYSQLWADISIYEWWKNFYMFINSIMLELWRKGNSCVSYKNDPVEKGIKITLNVFKSINSQICFFSFKRTEK